MSSGWTGASRRSTRAQSFEPPPPKSPPPPESLLEEPLSELDDQSPPDDQLSPDDEPELEEPKPAGLTGSGRASQLQRFDAMMRGATPGMASRIVCRIERMTETIARKNSEGALMEPRVVERMEASSCWVADAKETERESNTIWSRGRPSQHAMPIEPTCIPTV